MHTNVRFYAVLFKADSRLRALPAASRFRSTNKRIAADYAQAKGAVVLTQWIVQRNVTFAY